LRETINNLEDTFLIAALLLITQLVLMQTNIIKYEKMTAGMASTALAY